MRNGREPMRHNKDRLFAVQRLYCLYDIALEVPPDSCRRLRSAGWQGCDRMKRGSSVALFGARRTSSFGGRGHVHRGSALHQRRRTACSATPWPQCGAAGDGREKGWADLVSICPRSPPRAVEPIPPPSVNGYPGGPPSPVPPPSGHQTPAFGWGLGFLGGAF